MENNQYIQNPSDIERRVQEQMMCIMQAMQNIREIATEIRNDVRRQDTEISNHFVIMRRRRARIIRTIENVHTMNTENSQVPPEHLITRPINNRNRKRKPPKISKSPLTTIVLELFDNNIQHKKQECPICYINVLSKSLITTNCQHNFCNNCISSLIAKTNEFNLRCPICREDICTLKIYNQKNYEKMKTKQQKIIEKSQIL